MTFDLLAALLDTQALRLAPPGGVFWYTSGTVGPYYINTEYLYGGPEQAQQVLAFIDEHKEDADFPQRLQERVEAAIRGKCRVSPSCRWVGRAGARKRCAL